MRRDVSGVRGQTERVKLELRISKHDPTVRHDDRSSWTPMSDIGRARAAEAVWRAGARDREQGHASAAVTLDVSADLFNADTNALRVVMERGFASDRVRVRRWPRARAQLLLTLLLPAVSPDSFVVGRRRFCSGQIVTT